MMARRAHTPTDYHLASVPEKQRRQREAIREPGVVCPVCEAKTGAGELLAHLGERCEGPRPPHPFARWVSRPAAVARGVSASTLYRWVALGAVRTQGSGRSRLFLLRDIERAVAVRLWLSSGEAAEPEPSPQLVLPWVLTDSAAT